MDRFSRAMIAGISGCLLSGWILVSFGKRHGLWWTLVDRASKRSAPLGFLASLAVIALPFVVLWTVFELLPKSKFSTHEDEARCRKCGHSLRGISEPRCPECGERI